MLLPEGIARYLASNSKAASQTIAAALENGLESEPAVLIDAYARILDVVKSMDGKAQLVMEHVAPVGILTSFDVL